MTAAARVSHLIDAARGAFVVARTPALVDALAAETGLSREGVVLALDRSLEHDADAHAIARFVAKAPARSAVGVVLAGNVFTAPLRAIAWALAHAPRVIVRDSRRARVFSATLLAEAHALGANVEHAPPSDDPAADLDSLVAAIPPDGALHVYGGAGAIEAARRATAARPDLEVELHGPGFGVVVASAETLVARARDVAFDVTVFDQRGCLSPRVALVVDAGAGAPPAIDAIDAIDAELRAMGDAVPRGALDPSTRAQLRSAIDAAAFAGEARVGPHHALLSLGPDAPLTLPPAARALAIAPVASLDAAIERLRGHEGTLASIGAPLELHAALAHAFPRARISDLGAMQRPPLDGPVDRRVRP